MRGFLKRHPNVSKRVPEPVTQASANVSEANIRNWFKQVEEQYQEDKVFETIILNGCPDRHLNGDEIGVEVSPVPDSVLARKGSKNVAFVERGSSKNNITFTFIYQASGGLVPPLVIFKNTQEKQKAEIARALPKDWALGFSESGWTTSELFYKYMKETVIPFLKAKNVQLPCVLYLDNHVSHLSPEVLLLCRLENIIVVFLYPNSTRLLQPCDVGIFRPLRQYFKSESEKWEKENQFNIDSKFIPMIISNAAKRIDKQVVKNAFRTCGLFPWNPDALDYSKCLGKNMSVDNNRATFEELMREVHAEKNDFTAGKSRNESNEAINVNKSVTKEDVITCIGPEILLKIQTNNISSPEVKLASKILKLFGSIF